MDDTSAEKRYWNSRFEEEGIDAFLDHYPTKEEELPERLSEMFHHDRRGYIVGKALQQAIIPLLDSIDSSAGEGSVDTVVNDGGVLIGYVCNDNIKRWNLWFAKQ
ncbi:MAG: hypothetical protein QF442_02030 [Candidatus Peribacteraceae bacterium]|jgi:shikimate 5-dehydrogenase|nr:hypothetical protein [Candidatus Peribacteraceae bacterium]